MYKTLNNYYDVNKFVDTQKYVNINKYLRTGLKKPYLKSNQTYIDIKPSKPKTEKVPIKDDKRSIIDRLFDVLSVGNYTIAGGVKSTMEGDSFVKGFWRGLKASNPLGSGFQEGETTWSDVLEQGGWESDKLSGKIARGGVGFLLDVLLDPITYVSFGGGALLKGTGKAALKSTHSNVIRKLSDEFNVDVSNGMTEEAAKKIILKRSYKQKLDLTDEALKEEAKTLVNRFNKIIGVRDKARDIEFGLKYMPFGEKLFSDAKTIKLLDGETLQKISDKYHISSTYSLVRDRIYGSIIGKSFSTNSALYGLSKTNPEGFYDFIKFVDNVHGLDVDKIDKNKMIREYAEKLKDLTPAENKEIIDILEDPSKWKYVSNTINYLETQEGKRKKIELMAKKTKQKNQLEALTKKYNTIQSIIDETTQDVDKLKDKLKTLEEEYQKELFNINIKDIEDAADRRHYIGLLQKEVDRISAEKQEIGSKASNVLVDERKEILDSVVKERQERLNELKLEAKKITKELRKVVKEKNKQIDTLKKQKEEISASVDVESNEEIHSMLNRIDELKIEINKLEQVDYKKLYEPFITEWREIKQIREAYLKDKDVSKKLAQKVKTIDFTRKLSEYLTGRTNAIVFNTNEKNMDSLIDLMKKGYSQEEILKFIEVNNKYFDGTYPEMYSWIAKQLNYDSWHEVYWEKKKRKMSEIINKGYTTLNEIKELQELDVLKQKRDFLISKLIDSKDVKELMARISKFEDDILQYNRQDIIFADMKSKQIEKKLPKKVDLTMTDLPPQKVIDDMLKEKYTKEEVRKMIIDARREAREKGASKYQQDKISRQIKENYEGKNKYNSVEEAVAAYKELNKNKRYSGYKEDRYTEIVQRIVDAEQEKKLKELTSKELTAIDKNDIRDTLIEFLNKGEYIKNLGGGEKKSTTIKAPNTKFGYNTFVKAITHELYELVETFQWTDMYGYKQTKHWSLLSDKQKEVLINIALNNYYKGYSTKKKNFDIAKDVIKNEIKLRNEREKVAHIIDNVNVGDEVEIKLKEDELSKLTVTDYKLSDASGVQKFEYKGIDANGNEVTFYPSDVANILNPNSPKDIDGLIMQSGLVRNVVRRADELREEIAKIMQEIDVKSKEIVDETYSKVSKVNDELVKSEEELSTSQKVLGDEYNKIKTELDELRRQNKLDKAKLKRIDKKQIKQIEKLKQDIASKEDEILKKQKEIIKIQTNAKIYEEIKDKRIKKLTKIFDERVAMLTSKIEKYEKIIFEYSEKLKRAEFEKLDELVEEVQQMEKALESEDVFDTYMRSILGDTKIDKAIFLEKSDFVDVVLNDDVVVSDKIREVVNYIRSQMVEWGRKEVEAGSLKAEQLYANILRYVPHIATRHLEKILELKDIDDVEDMVENIDEIKKYISGFGAKYGFGRIANEFAKKRKFVIKQDDGTLIRRPTIEEANKYTQKGFGEDIFIDTISDIYLYRGLKHNELVYDDKYMKNMLDIFGDDLIHGVGVKHGYKAVMNFGRAKENMANLADLVVRTKISNDVGEYLRDIEVISKLKEDVVYKLSKKKFETQKEYNFAYKKLFGELISKESSNYIKKHYPDEVRLQLYQDSFKEIIETTFMKNTIEDIATPLLEISDEQIKAIQEVESKVKKEFIDTVRYSLIQLNKEFDSKMGFKVKLSETEIDGMSATKLKSFFKKIYANYVLDELDEARIQRLFAKLDYVDRFNVQIKQVNNAIVEKANRTRKVQIAKDNSRLLQLWDKVTHLIKLNQTTIIPAFHMRNKYSNTFNNWLTIGLDAIDIKLQKESAMTMYYKHIGKTEKLKDLVVDVNGKEMKWEELYDLAMEYDVIDKGFFGKDVGEIGEGFDKGLLGKYIKPEYDPTDAKNFVWYKKGAEIGSLIEGQDRLLHFVAVLRQGKTPREAAESVERTLFDYSDLTAFEKNVMKRIIPYYTWLRKNAALQLEMMLENPKKYMHISKIIHGVEGMVDEEDEINKALVNDFAKEWVQTPLVVTNPEGREEVVLWNPNLPYLDLERIPDPTNMSESMKELFTQTNPLIKVPIEQIQNYNYFFESPIVKEGGSQLRRLEHILNSTALYNVGSGLVRKEGIDLGLHVFNATSGVKLLSYDYDRYKYQKLDELRKKYGDDYKPETKYYNEALVRKMNELMGGKM